MVQQYKKCIMPTVSQCLPIPLLHLMGATSMAYQRCFRQYVPGCTPGPLLIAPQLLFQISRQTFLFSHPRISPCSSTECKCLASTTSCSLAFEMFQSLHFCLMVQYVPSPLPSFQLSLTLPLLAQHIVNCTMSIHCMNILQFCARGK